MTKFPKNQLKIYNNDKEDEFSLADGWLLRGTGHGQVWKLWMMTLSRRLEIALTAQQIEVRVL